MSILLVEDYEFLRNDLAELLEELVKSVTVASNGAEALKIYQAYHNKNSKGFDILVTDIQMPKMNGIELCEAVLKINTSQQIIVLSAHTDSEYLIKLINLGVAQFINKPIDKDILMNAFYKLSIGNDILVSESQNKQIIDLGEGYSWNKEKNRLMQGNCSVKLTRYEYFLMIFLLERAEEILTNDSLICYFYENSIDIDEKNIRNIVFKLRKKIPNNLIHSIYGMGYKLTPLI